MMHMLTLDAMRSLAHKAAHRTACGSRAAELRSRCDAMAYLPVSGDGAPLPKDVPEWVSAAEQVGRFMGIHAAGCPFDVSLHFDVERDVFVLRATAKPA